MMELIECTSSINIDLCFKRRNCKGHRDIMFQNILSCRCLALPNKN